MKNQSTAVLAFVVSAFLVAGCDDTPETPKTSSNDLTGTELIPSGGKSVALPPDKMPPSDASISPSPPVAAQGSGVANSPTQANPEQLSKGQEQTAMPTTGQANNYSPPQTGGQATTGPVK